MLHVFEVNKALKGIKALVCFFRAEGLGNGARSMITARDGYSWYLGTATLCFISPFHQCLPSPPNDTLKKTVSLP